MSDAWKDFGDRRRHIRLISLLFAVLFPAMMAAAILMAWAFETRKRAEISAAARAQGPAYRVEGPACPVGDLGELARLRLLPDESFQFNTAQFAYRFGNVDCGWVETQERRGRRGYPVCQFTAPGSITVWARNKEYVFFPGVGSPATVAVIDGVPSCVMGSNFKI